MFTGIIESLGKVVNLRQERGNLHMDIQSAISRELKVDQSLAHNGVCLTVVRVGGDIHEVTAIEETLKKSNLSQLSVGSLVNLERCLQLNGRIDGHLVQGHVDQTALCTNYVPLEGSWEYTFEYDVSKGNLTIEKGSIAVDGVSLTVVNSSEGKFSVSIIPYTYAHTNFQQIRAGTHVNLEFDMIGKYIAKLVPKLT